MAVIDLPLKNNNIWTNLKEIKDKYNLIYKIMAEPNMNCMIVNVWIHHMQVDELFDFLNMRIDRAPYYWLNEASVPTSITGGYIMISLPYSSYSHLSSNRNWDEAPGWIKQ